MEIKRLGLSTPTVRNVEDVRNVPTCPMIISSTDKTRHRNVHPDKSDSWKGRYKPCPICNKEIFTCNLQRHLGKHVGVCYQCPPVFQMGRKFSSLSLPLPF